MIRPEGTYICTNPECKAKYAEYVNGCPRCCTGEPGGSHRVVHEDDYPKTVINISESDLNYEIDRLRKKLNIKQ